ncbi:MAG TPA: glycine zipper domain-containing protein [Thermoanaerobaculia bacterium]
MTRTAPIALSMLLILPAAPGAQSQTPPASKPKTLAATVGVYVFPAAGQPADRQSIDEADCYKWAVGNTGVDPFEVQKAAQQQAQQTEAARQGAASAGKGTGAKGAVAGAAAGALIGEIADNDAGKGAAIGAAAGLLAGRRRGRQTQAQAQQQVEQQAQQAQQVTFEQQEAFKKAFSACLEAKKYVVKF